MGASGISAGPNRRRLQNGLVIVQLAVSVMLLVGASLLGRSLVRLMTTDIGVRTDHVATAALNLSYQRRITDAQRTALVDAIVERVRSVPNVQAVGAGTGLPPNASTSRITLKRFGDAVDYQAAGVSVSPEYFSALGVQLLKGRLFSAADTETGKPVMIMTANTARRFFDVDDPIGRTMSLPVLRNGVGGAEEMTLVGVIANVKHSGLQAAPDDAVYRPLRQQPWSLLFLVARTSADPSVLASMLRREIAVIDPAIAVSSVGTLDAIIKSEAAQPRFRSAVVTSLATVTLTIGAVGLYGVVAHTVSQRTREFGVRMALGADSVDLMRLVFLEGGRLAGAGIVSGVAASLAATRVLATLLYGIEPSDAFSFGFASGLLLLVTAAASYLPARKAARLDPIAALRAE
jgi:predicted permease